MSEFVLDTNICIYVINNKPEAIKTKIYSLKQDDIFLTSITIAELYFGVEKSKFREKNLLALQKFILPFSVIDFDYTVAQIYGKIRMSLERKGNLIGPNDLLIASCALAHNKILVSNNIKEFTRIQSLRVENWLDEEF